MHLFLLKRTLVPLVLKMTLTYLKGDGRRRGRLLSPLQPREVVFLLRSLAEELPGCEKTDSWILPQVH